MRRIALFVLISAFCAAAWAQARYEPSPMQVVHAMLELARVGPADVVYDLGCGDGRIVIAAAKLHGARGVCVDRDPERIAESTQNARAAGVAERIRFVTEDLFEADLQAATVVALFLTHDLNLKLRPRLLRELRSGARIVSHYHGMGDWPPEAVRHVEIESGTRSVFLWSVPRP